MVFISQYFDVWKILEQDLDEFIFVCFYLLYFFFNCGGFCFFVKYFLQFVDVFWFEVMGDLVCVFLEDGIYEN